MFACPRCGEMLPSPSDCFQCRAIASVAREEGVTFDDALAVVLEGRARLAQRQAELSPAQRDAERVAASERVQERLEGHLPLHVAPLGRVLEFPVRYLADDAQAFDQVLLRFDDQGAWCYDRAAGIRVIFRPWWHVRRIEVAGPDAAQRRPTLPRMAAVGLFSLAWRKNVTRSYVIVETTAFAQLFFEVTGKTVFEVRAALSPVTAWLTANEDALREIA